jgi:putative spermidine/putrescine transport system permease protein
MAAVIGDLALAGGDIAGGGTPVVSGSSVGRRARWRWPVLVVAGLYFLVPLYAAFRFALQSNTNGFSVSAFTGLPQQAGFTSALGLSFRLALIATAITLVLMVPTTVYVHLRVPQLRPLFDLVTLLPIVIPPVVLIVGVLQVAPTSLKATPNLLGLEYAVLAMPFAYRSLDAGLSAIDVRTLFDASRSLGGGSLATLVRVILPNMRAALLSATVLTVALVLGEYTMASLALFQTFPVWIVLFQQTSGHVSVAVSLLALIVTWLVLLAISSLDRRRTQRRRTAPVAGRIVPGSPSPPAVQGAPA